MVVCIQNTDAGESRNYSVVSARSSCAVEGAGSSAIVTHLSSNAAMPRSGQTASHAIKNVQELAKTPWGNNPTRGPEYRQDSPRRMEFKCRKEEAVLADQLICSVDDQIVEVGQASTLSGVELRLSHNIAENIKTARATLLPVQARLLATSLLKAADRAEGKVPSSFAKQIH